jgi:hypothetical protein
MGPKWTKIWVADGALHIRHGWVFRMDTPLNGVESARIVREQRPWALGVHTGGGVWLVNGSRHGIVEVKLTRPVTPKTILMIGGGDLITRPVRTLYISLNEPDSFVAALTSRR